LARQLVDSDHLSQEELVIVRELHLVEINPAGIGHIDLWLLLLGAFGLDDIIEPNFGKFCIWILLGVVFLGVL
jgi:hypothetical protein